MTKAIENRKIGRRALAEGLFPRSGARSAISLDRGKTKQADVSSRRIRGTATDAGPKTVVLF